MLGLLPCKRRRGPGGAPRAPAAAVKKSKSKSSSSSSSSWASLQEDILRLVAGRMLAGDVVDYLHLRAVCHHWRSTVACPRGRGVTDPRFHPRHWIMLPEGYRIYPGHTKLRGYVRFFNLRTGSLARLYLPIFKDHFAMESIDGLLLLHRDHDMLVRVLHPFTGDILDLPSLATLLRQVKGHSHPLEVAYFKDRYYLHMIRRVHAACISVSPDGVLTAMLAIGAQDLHRVAFASSEDQQWALSSWQTATNPKFIASQGKLYFISQLQFFVIDPPQLEKGSSSTPSSLPPPKLIAACPPDMDLCAPQLAECDSEILFIGRTDVSLLHVVIYKLADIIMGRFIPVKSIGENSLFLSMYGALCVSSKANPTIAGDSIVVLRPASRCLGQYHVKSDTWSIASDGDLLHGPIPSPYTLIHHIYTCCVRFFWNKGQLYCPAAYHNTWGRKEKWRIGG